MYAHQSTPPILYVHESTSNPDSNASLKKLDQIRSEVLPIFQILILSLHALLQSHITFPLRATLGAIV